MNPSNQMDWRRPDPDVHGAAVVMGAGAVAGGAPAVPAHGTPVRAEAVAAAGADMQRVEHTAGREGTGHPRDRPEADRNRAQQAGGRPAVRTEHSGQHVVRRIAPVHDGSAVRSTLAVWCMLDVSSCEHILQNIRNGAKVTKKACNQ